MIAEEKNNNNQNPRLSIDKGKSVSLILNILKEVPNHFIKALNNYEIKDKLNENDLTQILVEQINALLIIKEYSILAQNQYSDIFYGTKGIPDFYFYATELGKTNPPLFVIESKRLPAPTRDREKEYVIGNNKNGGIERFKIEKHGKGFEQSGLLGFIEQESFEYWSSIVNKWIEELSITNTYWNVDEKLENIVIQNELCYLESMARRKINKIKLHHIWININNAR